MEWLLALFMLKPDPALVYENNRALSHLAEENKGLAVSELSALMQKYSDNPIVIWNFSYALVANERFEDAHKIFDFFLSEYLADPLMRDFLFFVHFNQAKVFTAEKKKKEAIDSYLEAFRINPKSKEVVVNLELLLQDNDGGGGSGQDQQEQQQQQQQDQQEQEQDKEQQQEQKKQQKPQPKPFDSKDLSKEDVKRILDELKRQEEKIREKIQDKQPKQRSNGKDW